MEFSEKVADDTAKGYAMNFSGTQRFYASRRMGETQTSCFYSQTDDSTDDSKEETQ